MLRFDWAPRQQWLTRASPRLGPDLLRAKSVSLAALVGGDERLVVAHDAAVKEALGWLQENALITRARSNGQVLEEQTGQMLAAVFRHDLSRAAEPQLHSHAVVMNATIDANGKWRSVHSIRLYSNAKEAGERYQQALAVRAAELGYAIVPSRNGTFELDGVPREVILGFSSRAKAVEERLAEQGLTRASATGPRNARTPRCAPAAPSRRSTGSANACRTGSLHAKPAWIWSGLSARPARGGARGRTGNSREHAQSHRGLRPKSRPSR